MISSESHGRGVAAPAPGAHARRPRPPRLRAPRRAIAASSVLLAASLIALALTAASALALPEGRAYEMVSPVFKGGYGAKTIEAVAPDGEGVVLNSLGAFAGAPASYPVNGLYLARRGALGWSTASLTPPASLALTHHWGPQFSATLDSTLDWGEPGPNAKAAEEGPEKELLLHSNAAPDTAENWQVAGPVLEDLQEKPFVSQELGASPDLCHVLLATGTTQEVAGEDALLPEAGTATARQLYDLARGCGGQPFSLRLVGVKNTLGLNKEHELIDPYCPVKLGAASGRESVFQAIAAGGGVLFFTTNSNRADKGECDATKQGPEVPTNPAILYARLGGQRTLQISAPIAGDCAVSAPCHSAVQQRAEFVGASEDGSRVFFTTSQPLVTRDLDNANDLYMASIGCPEGTPECELAEREVTSLTQVSHDSNAGEAGEVQGALNVAPDGSRVYFVARGALSGANAEGHAPVKGADNLYVYDANAGVTVFVGELCSGEAHSGEVEDMRCPAGKVSDGLWVALNGESQTAGRDGRFLLFSTYAQLLSNDTDTAKDVYRYDAQSGMLDRVSAGEGGHDANGNDSAFGAVIPSAEFLGRVTEYGDLKARAISEDGTRVVFGSAEPLSEAAGNHVENVYEWHKEPGWGEGQVSLISSGASTEPDHFFTISPSGRDIFFVTTDGLLPQDADGAPDVYDARIGGGFPTAPGQREECSADACQGPLTNPAPLLVPGSIFQPPGENLPAPTKATPKPKAKKHKPKKRKRRRRARRAVHAAGATALLQAAHSQPPSAPSAPSTSSQPSHSGSSLSVGQLASAAASAAARRARTSPTAAVEAEPFAITKFTMQTTSPTRMEPLEAGHTCPGFCRFINEPEAFTQAGGHPWALTTTIAFASEEFPTEHEGQRPSVVPTRDPKDIVVDLPPGLLGNPTAVPRCSLTNILTKGEVCPAATQVGFARTVLFGGHELDGPIVNVTPEAGQSAEFTLENESHIDYVLTGHVVHTPAGYGLTVVSNEIPMVELVEAELTFWGVPADPSHDVQRGLICGKSQYKDEPPLYVTCFYQGEGAGQDAGIPPVPFLSMPADCAAGPESASVRADNWEEPGQYLEKQVETPLPTAAGGAQHGFSGCNELRFDPSLEVLPDTLLADEPVGLGVNLKVPQPETPETNSTPQLRDSVVTLPLGLSISPGVVDGIQACERSGPEGINFDGPESEEIGLNGEAQLAPGHCPDASKVGTAEAITPLLPEPVKGHIYLARPGCGGEGQAACSEADALDGNLYRLYLELGGKGPLLGRTGVNLKVEGKVKANPATGQLTAVFEDTPQLPFSELKIHLNGGPRAPLDTPAACGRATTSSDFTPWSAPGTTPEGLLGAGTPDALPSSFFEVGGCPSPTPFNPGFQAGTVTPNAGKFSPFTLNLTRNDREQFVKGIQLHTPPGLLGMLSSVQLCGEPQANEGTCPQSSRIGSTRVASGAGSHPFEIEGQVYLTGPHDGAPFGLSIVTHAVAGPFNLGLVVVRARIDVDPENSTLTVTTDETGPYAIPQIIFGVPLRLKHITVNIDRPGFMFNPTNCGGAAQQITAVVSGDQNATAHLSSPFAVGGCKSLAFKPSFKVSTSGHTSKANGASLDAKVSYPPGSVGTQANIAYAKVELPKALPSRLTTLQKACVAAVFAANPAACPQASIIGIVRATTPVLPVPLSGPVYFVSHGGEAFPSLVAVLQGDGVRVDLTGTTFISKAGVTSSTFKTVPDVPVNTFELYLPQGPYSALAANTNLCQAASKLVMPTEFVAQNGAVLKQNTKIAVRGCGTAKAKAKPKSRHKRANRRHR